MTKTITVPNPNSLETAKELVIIPRKEYEALVRIKFKGIPEARLTLKQKRVISRSEQELRKGEYLTLNELDKYLARSRSKTRR